MFCSSSRSFSIPWFGKHSPLLCFSIHSLNTHPAIALGHEQTDMRVRVLTFVVVWALFASRVGVDRLHDGERGMLCHQHPLLHVAAGAERGGVFAAGAGVGLRIRALRTLPDLVDAVSLSSECHIDAHSSRSRASDVSCACRWRSSSFLSAVCCFVSRVVWWPSSSAEENWWVLLHSPLQTSLFFLVSYVMVTEWLPLLFILVQIINLMDASNLYFLIHGSSVDIKRTSQNCRHRSKTL